jgi:anthranilate synthase component 1
MILRKEVHMLTKNTHVKTIYRELPADEETPRLAYLKLRGNGPSYLLESLEGGDGMTRYARYSFVGVRQHTKYVIHNNLITIITGDNVRTVTVEPGTDPTIFLQKEVERYHTEPVPGLPRFVGGLVGYLGYEGVRFFEPTLSSVMSSSVLPDAIYLLSDTIVAFDHGQGTMFLITHILDGDEVAASKRLDAIENALQAPRPLSSPSPKGAFRPEIRSNMTKNDFIKSVGLAKEHIAAGNSFQIVLSQCFSRETSADPFDIYRAVRRLNPSPYMFFFDFGNVDDKPLYLVGASPETLVSLEDGQASIRPIAGTRPRGADPKSDDKLAAELLADPKERAEHVMLVDLGRNDIGRVCKFGTVNVPEFFVIERYSHVMHIASHVVGTLSPELTAFDLVRASFPAGTVSGAPKVRAMEIIAQLEPNPRGPYAGMVGYFGFDGAMDTCITIRTLVAHGKTVSVQAGAGIVADSDPATEYQETVNKASAMLKAIEMAEGN